MLQDVIVYSIGMVTDETNTLEGLESTQKFLRSLGRFGNGAFLWPSYGVGDIPQAFSRQVFSSLCVFTLVVPPLKSKVESCNSQKFLKSLTPIC